MRRLMAAVMAVGLMASPAVAGDEWLAKEFRKISKPAQDFYIMGFSDALVRTGMVDCTGIRRGAVIEQAQGHMVDYPDEKVELLISRAMGQLGCRVLPQQRDPA
jgi:hypothetical protein